MFGRSSVLANSYHENCKRYNKSTGTLQTGFVLGIIWKNRIHTCIAIKILRKQMAKPTHAPRTCKQTPGRQRVEIIIYVRN
jgi:hypothetical protein